jgi:hypothetical protein
LPGLISCFAAQDATNSACWPTVWIPFAAETDKHLQMRNELETVVGRNATDAWKQVRDPAALPYTAKVGGKRFCITVLLFP